MGDIRLSDAALQGVIHGTANLWNGDSNRTFQIYKGTFPTDFSQVTGRGSDLLIAYSPTSDYWDIQNGVWTLKPDKLPPPSTASQNGTPTWFLIFSTTVLTYTSRQYVWGSVSAAGGGGDLTIPSGTVEAGKQYSLSSFSITFPNEITY